MDRKSSMALGAILLLALVVRVIAADQPIVENYVGRQIPTAMVARNLERGSGFFYPRVAVSPQPNYFLIEPPLYAGAAAILARAGGIELSVAGRIVSALGTVLGVWGLFGLVVRREGVAVALASVAVFAFLPVTLRYGRSFQPDALMLGCILAGMRGWDEFESGKGSRWLILGCVGLSMGLALKVVSAYVFLPMAFGVIRDRKPWKLVLLVATLGPALLWYVHAAQVVTHSSGSLAMADNRAIWLKVFESNAWVRSETYVNVIRFLGIRAFTPIGPFLAVLGFARGRVDRLWIFWAVAVFGAMALMAAKLHHEYYWLAIAPVASVGIARYLVGRPGVGGDSHESSRIAVRIAISLVFAGMCAGFSASTWKTPAEWTSLRTAAESVRTIVPEGALIVAPEALIYEADRQGCRIEFSKSAARRAAGEWADPTANSVDGPISLVEFYRRHGARFFADVVPDRPDPRRLALHEAVRRRYNVVSETAGVLIASLNDPTEAVAHGQEPKTDGNPRSGDDPRLRPVEGARP